MTKKRDAEEPASEKTPNDPMSDSVERHPAYGQIGASRWSGQRTLYGSDFKHQHFVTITIRRSELRRGLARDWPCGLDELIEVSLSEAQWAEFVSTMNSGLGTQCTIDFIGGVGRVPEIVRTTDRRAQFSGEMKARAEKALGRLDKLLKQLDGATIGRKQKEELIMAAKLARQDVVSDLPFVAQSFDEHIETGIARAKAEIHGYMQHVITRAGLAAIVEREQMPLLLDEPSDENGGKR
jgi:hypothetical protein